MGLGCVNTGPTALAGRTAAPYSWGLGASTQRQRLAALRPPLLTGWVCVCMEPKHPVSQNAAGGKPLLVGLPPVNSHHRPIRNETQNARPLLVGRAFVYFEPTALAGRTAARRSSMRAGSSVSSISKPVS